MNTSYQGEHIKYRVFISEVGTTVSKVFILHTRQVLSILDRFILTLIHCMKVIKLSTSMEFTMSR